MKKVKRIKQAMLIAVCCLVAAVATGCGAELSYFYDSDNLVSTHNLLFSMPSDELTAADQLGRPRQTTGGGLQLKWTVSDYLSALADEIGATTQTDNANGLFRFQLDLVDAEEDDAYDQYFSREKPVAYEWGFFTYSGTVTQKNPFYGTLTALNSGAQEGSIVSLIRDGNNSLPALHECFNLPDTVDPGELNVSFYLKAKPGMQGDGENETSVLTRYIRWNGTLNELDKKEITYTFYVPNSFGWNILALLLAFAVIGLIYLGTRNSKRQPRLLTVQPRFRPVPHLNVRDIDVFGLNTPPGQNGFDPYGNPLPPGQGGFDPYGNPLPPGQSSFPLDPYGNPVYPPYGYPLSPEQQREKAKRELENIFGAPLQPQQPAQPQPPTQPQPPPEQPAPPEAPPPQPPPEQPAPPAQSEGGEAAPEKPKRGRPRKKPPEPPADGTDEK